MPDDFDRYLAEKRRELRLDTFWREYLLELVTCAAAVTFAALCLGLIPYPAA